VNNRPLGRVLIVEVDEMRCAWFQQKLASYILDLTCDAQQAIEWFAEREYATILLDHDLVA